MAKFRVSASTAQVAAMIGAPVWSRSIGGRAFHECTSPNGKSVDIVHVPGNGTVLFECEYFVEFDTLDAVESAQALGAAPKPDVILTFGHPRGGIEHVSCAREEWEAVMQRKLKLGYSFQGKKDP